MSEATGDELRTALAEVGLDELSETLTRTVKTIAESAADRATAPLRQHHERQLQAEIDHETSTTMQSFQAKHDDWAPGNDVDKAMAKIAGQVELKRDPNTGKAQMTDMEYLETLHSLATKEKRAAVPARETEPEPTEPPEDATFKDAAEAAKRGVRWGNAVLNTKGRRRSVDSARPTNVPPKGAGFKEAAAAAKAGVRWE